MDDEAVTVEPPPVPPKTKPRVSGHFPSLHKSSASLAARTTVNLNSVDFNIPADFQEFTYSCKNNAKSHVVKILINPEETRLLSSGEENNGQSVTCENNRISDVGDNVPAPSCIRISVNTCGVIQNNPNMVDAVGRSSPHYFFNQFNGVMSSGQVSPSDTLDSGTCSDLDGTPPPLPKKKGGSGVSVTLIGSHKKTASCSSGAEVDSDDNESNSSTSSISCDSLNSGKLFPVSNKSQLPGSKAPNQASILPQTLLQDIRQRNHVKESFINGIVDQKSYEERQQEVIIDNTQTLDSFDPDMFYDFHLNEKDNNNDIVSVKSVIEDETFAGYKDLLGDGASTIRSAKGTVRGVKNRVRAGIATFLHINSTGKNYKEKDSGKIVVYTTTMGIIRDTYQACMKVKQILRTLLVKFEERDVFMSTEYQTDIRERMKCDQILVPQVYVDGQHVGDADTIERLNESGELRKILKPYRSPDACTTCQVCGGYRLLPCPTCNGSKKSVHRNHFTAEFVALKCMNCDEAALIKCTSC